MKKKELLEDLQHDNCQTCMYQFVVATANLIYCQFQHITTETTA